MGPLTKPEDEPADSDTVDNLTDDNKRESPRCFRQRERTGGGCGDREAIKDQGRCIVGQAFALEHDKQPSREREPTCGRQRGNDIGGATMAPSTKPVAQLKFSR